MIVVLAGGVGAARFLQGLVQIVPQDQITVIGNTGDDREFYGLHVSPDLDIVTYTLAGVVDETKAGAFATIPTTSCHSSRATATKTGLCLETATSPHIFTARTCCVRAKP